MSINISVIIPCYKQAHFLADAIESALDQGRDDVEVIVINDGSPDDTAAVAARYGDRIVYIEQENRGLSGARNTGIRAATGHYIALLDSDDEYLPGALDRLAAHLDQHPDIALVCGDVILFDETGDLGRKSAYDGTPRNPDNFRWEVVGFYITPSTVMVRREVFDTIGLFDEALKNAAEDWLMWVQIARRYKMAYLDAPVTHYRQHPNNATRKVDQLAAGNRYAVKTVVEADYFGEYPRHFRAQLLFYRFATAWRAESRWQAMGYLLRALFTDPSQIGFLSTTLRRTWRRRSRLRSLRQLSN